MAKLSANGERLVEAFTVERETGAPQGQAPGRTRERWALRSDGSVLRRTIWWSVPQDPARGLKGYTVEETTGYKVAGRMRAGREATGAQLRALLERRGYVFV